MNNLATGDVVTLDGSFGTVTLNGADATVEIRGTAKSVVNNLTGSPSVSDDTRAPQVNAEMLDVLNTDTFAEPGQGAPGATITLAAKIGYIYKFLRNRKTATATLINVYNDDTTTVDHKRTISDNGTTYDEEEVVTGP